jgi:hypothetical protein
MKEIKSPVSQARLDSFWLDFAGAIDEDGLCYLSPYTVNYQVPGTCVHLTDNGCSLSREDMPFGCVASMGCKPAVMNYYESAAVLWGNAYGRKVCDDYGSALERIRSRMEKTTLTLDVDEEIIKQKIFHLQ